MIGLIFAQHQLKDGVQRKDTTTLDESLDLLGRHIDAIGPEHVAIGSDLDGFIKPTLGGIESAADLKPFAQALRAALSRRPRDADARRQRAARHPDALRQRRTLTPRISISTSSRGVHDAQQHGVARRAAQDRAHAGLVDVNVGDVAGVAAAGAGRRGARSPRA